jgi:hypothetical protein
MQKIVQLKPNNESISIEVSMKGNINSYYEMRLYQKDSGKIKTFEGDNFYPNDDTFTLPDTAHDNINRTLVLDVSFNSKDIPPLPDLKASFKVKFYQAGIEIDSESLSQELTGEKQYFLLFVKFS